MKTMHKTNRPFADDTCQQSKTPVVKLFELRIQLAGHIWLAAFFFCAVR